MEENKKCRRCEIEQPLSNFYKGSFVHGRCNICISCTRSKAKENREAQGVFVKISAESKLNVKKRSKASKARRNSAYFSNKEKKQAARATEKLPRPEGCELHHWSYRKEHLKDIIPLPVEVHRFLHTNIIYDKELLCYRTKAGELLDTKEKHVAFIGFLTNYLKAVMSMVVDMEPEL